MYAAGENGDSHSKVSRNCKGLIHVLGQVFAKAAQSLTPIMKFIASHPGHQTTQAIFQFSLDAIMSFLGFVRGLTREWLDSQCLCLAGSFGQVEQVWQVLLQALVGQKVWLEPWGRLLLLEVHVLD